ncbi:hypothetical protein N665_0139s0053 [Sinapis alba]|nr:hypothetical protein N665_0139s0053 [Sinapis alba]
MVFQLHNLRVKWSLISHCLIRAMRILYTYST